MCGYDAIGSYDLMTYGAQGSGIELAMPVLDNQFKYINNIHPVKPTDRDSVVDVVKDSINSVAERDIYTGKQSS